jgi:3-oxoacyl-[acyl-carrier-protein] synthase-3|tara:strand:- start:972 stop:1937 length:966 start_codon:yes stop_codon:yes gene_type:complete
MYSRIISVGSYQPDNIVTNEELEHKVDTSDEWIRTRTGIESRAIAEPTQATSDLAILAADAAIKRSGITKDEIDLIIVGTCTPDVATPNVGVIIQESLGLNSCPAFSIEAACSGFIYALNIANKFILSGESKCALVVGAETLSRITDWNDRNTCVLFADGAGAVILKPSEDTGIIYSEISADGTYADLLYVPYGTSRKPINENENDYFLQMNGNEVFKVAVKKLESIAINTLKKNNLTADDIDWLIPHQANIRIIQAVAKRLGMPMEKVIVTLAEHGNTSAASIPLALDKAITDGRISKGDKILLQGFGAGFTWGTALLTL